MERGIVYGSRFLNEHEKNYCITRLEMLALVTYVDHFCYYLLSQKFLLRTDHHSLSWLMSFKEPQRQVSHWLERLQEYDYEIQHRPGKLHGNADSLSAWAESPSRMPVMCAFCTTKVVSEGEVWSPEKVARTQGEDPDIGPVVKQLLWEWKKSTTQELQLLSRATREVWAQTELLKLQQGVVYLRPGEDTLKARSRMVLPKKLISSKKRSLQFTMAQQVPT